MTQTFSVSADLSFSADLPGRGTLSGSLTSEGQRAELRLGGPLARSLALDARTLRALASAIAELGATVRVFLDDEAVLELGLTPARWWQRIPGGSRHVTLINPRRAGVLALRRRRGGGSVTARDLLPPLTLLPLAPTFAAQRRPVTTTHDPRRGGNPRLVLVTEEPFGDDAPEVVFPLRGDLTLIGSGEQCDIRIPGLDEIHAAVIHDDRDELVVEDRSLRRTTRVNGAPAADALLRTGARITCGETILVYRRAEYADHGRPFGGRVGGELGHQRRQPDPRRQTVATGTRGLLSFPLRLRGPR